ncbi:unnamed protein product [Bursaphelenchus okinawaensis]|uniref:PAP-associated domain-containing protein n=1 Tax=Bursaphelenchus okinawaensis TaxID=465554 RepID=A0A811LPM8_9BILA|nr:unnamed protein product [Bursaphelenchus okinawaensis]CAG9126530.1 unnamed protein product [Bursaphelenchus okinawaensis]
MGRHVWGVTYNREYVKQQELKYKLKEYQLEPEDLERLSWEMTDLYNSNLITEADRRFRDKLIEVLNEKLKNVYPGGYLACGGSTVSNCGTTTSDIDLCYVLKTSDYYGEKDLPIVMYKEGRDRLLKVNHFILNRIGAILKDLDAVKSIKLVDATVPIVKMQINTKLLGISQVDKTIEVDINCNCVAGVYNSFLLGGLVNFDRRLAILSVILKKWGKQVKIVDEKRFNSYALVLLVVHYLQCGVYPPVLPNLMHLLPDKYGGTIEPRHLTTSIEGLPDHIYEVKRNEMNVGELLMGFLKYYADFEMTAMDVRVKTGEVIEKRNSQIRKGDWSAFFLEEPYDEITVPKNLRLSFDLDFILKQFRDMADLMYKNPTLSTLYSITNPSRSKKQQLREQEEDEDI